MVGSPEGTGGGEVVVEEVAVAGEVVAAAGTDDRQVL